MKLSKFIAQLQKIEETNPDAAVVIQGASEFAPPMRPTEVSVQTSETETQGGTVWIRMEPV